MATVDDILAKVIMLTDRGRLKWELIGLTGFRAQVDSLFLTILRDDLQNFIFTVYDEDGHALEESVSGFRDSHPGQLFELARRAALKVDENLERLDRRLNELI